MKNREKEVMVKTENGDISLRSLTEADLPSVVLNESEKGTYLNLKSMFIGEDEEFLYEKRIFKWTNMEKVSMYILKVPKNMGSFLKIKSEEDILKLALEQFRIKSDKEKSGTLTQTDPNKYLDKLATALLAQGVSEEEVEAIRTLGKEALSKKGTQGMPQTNSQKVVLRKKGK